MESRQEPFIGRLTSLEIGSLYIEGLESREHQHDTDGNRTMMKPVNATILLLTLLLLCRGVSGRNASPRACHHRQQPLAAVLPSSIVKNLAKGSFLKCAADLTGGLVSRVTSLDD